MKILENNDYIIEVKKCHRGIRMSLPERKISPHSTPFIKQYIINKNQLFSNDVNMPHLPEILKPVDIPAYAIKSAIYVDMLQHCRLFNYEPDVIKVEKEYGINNVWNLLPELEEETERKSAILLAALMTKSDQSEVAIKNGVEEGYFKLRPHLEKM